MRTLMTTVAFLGLLTGVAVPQAGEPIRLQVTPEMALAPAFLTVKVRVEAAPENRKLQVVAESANYYRSSEVPLEGVNSDPLSVFEFRDLPSGVYQVTGTLIGVNGPRASAWKVARVQPSTGR